MKNKIEKVPITFKAWCNKQPNATNKTKERLVHGYGDFCTAYRRVNEIGRQIYRQKYNVT